MEKEDGRVARDLSATCMREITVKTKSMAMEFSLGQVGTLTRESTKMTREMATER